MSSTAALPPALPAMWRALKRGYEAAPSLLSVSLGLALAAALPDALLALWFKLLADGVLGGRRGLVTTAAVGLGVSAAATWFLRVISERTQRRVRRPGALAPRSPVAGLPAAGGAGEHHQRPPFFHPLPAARRLGALVRSRRAGPAAQRSVARAGVGPFRGCLRGCGGVRGVSACVTARRRAAGAGGGLAPLGVHRRHRGRDRIPSRHLARGVETAGLVGGLRRRAVARRRRPGARPTGRRHPLRARVFRLSRDGAAGARRRGPPPRAGLGGRHCGRERRRQDDAGEAPVPAVSADQGAHPRGRRGTGAHAAGHVAVAPPRRGSRPFPGRGPGASHRGCRGPAAPRRPAGPGGPRPTRRGARRRAAGPRRGPGPAPPPPG